MTSGVEPWTRAVCPVSMELGGGGDEGKLNDVEVVAAIETSIFSLLLPFTCMSSSLIGRQRLLFFFFFVPKSIAFCCLVLYHHITCKNRKGRLVFLVLCLGVATPFMVVHADIE